MAAPRAVTGLDPIEGKEGDVVGADALILGADTAPPPPPPPGTCTAVIAFTAFNPEARTVATFATFATTSKGEGKTDLADSASDTPT